MVGHQLPMRQMGTNEEVGCASFTVSRVSLKHIVQRVGGNSIQTLCQLSSRCRIHTSHYSAKERLLRRDDVHAAAAKLQRVTADHMYAASKKSSKSQATSFMPDSAPTAND